MDSIEIARRAKKAVDQIVFDLSDRRGLGGEWDRIDDDIREEIVREWRALVAAAFWRGGVSMGKPRDAKLARAVQDEVVHRRGGRPPSYQHCLALVRGAPKAGSWEDADIVAHCAERTR